MPPRIDGFDDLTLIGRGGFGTVYRARQTRVDRVVAVKVLDVVDVDEAARRRFERECQAMGRLSWHPHVVVLHDSGLCEEDSRPWLSMEYLPAGSFGDLVETRGALAWQDALARGVEVAGALGAAHGAGVLHRDLKPENLLVGPFGEAKLGDFGIAAFEGSGATTGHATFSVAHVAPEILEGAEPDERADLYGLASTLFTLVDGAPPVVDGSPSLAAQITRVLREPARTLSGVPDDVARLLAESLAKDPDVRPVDAAAFGQQLQRAQRDHGLPVTELRLAARGVAERGLDENAAAEAEDEPPSDGGSGAGPTSIEGPGARPAADRRPTISIPTPGPLPAPAPEADAPPAPAPRSESEGEATRGGRRPARAVAAGALLVLLLIGGAVVWRWADGGSDDPPGGPVETSPRVESIAVGSAPRGVVATPAGVWVANSDDDSVTRLTGSGDEVATIGVGAQPHRVAATADSLWVTNTGDGTVSRIDAESDAVVATIDVGSRPTGIAATGDSVWLINFGDRSVMRIDPATDAVVTTVPLDADARGIAVSDEAVWLVLRDEGAVVRVDPDVGEEVARVRVGARPSDVAADDQGVWVTVEGDGTLVQVDEASNEVVATVDVGDAPNLVATDDEDVWVADAGPGRVVRIDARTSRVVETADIDTPARGLGAAAGLVWASAIDPDTLLRVDPGA